MSSSPTGTVDYNVQIRLVLLSNVLTIVTIMIITNTFLRASQLLLMIITFNQVLLQSLLSLFQRNKHVTAVACVICIPQLKLGTGHGHMLIYSH